MRALTLPEMLVESQGTETATVTAILSLPHFLTLGLTWCVVVERGIMLYPERLQIVLNQEIQQQLRDMSALTGQSKCAIVREGIKIMTAQHQQLIKEA